MLFSLIQTIQTELHNAMLIFFHHSKHMQNKFANVFHSIVSLEAIDKDFELMQNSSVPPMKEA